MQPAKYRYAAQNIDYRRLLLFKQKESNGRLRDVAVGLGDQRLVRQLLRTQTIAHNEQRRKRIDDRKTRRPSNQRNIA